MDTLTFYCTIKYNFLLNKSHWYVDFSAFYFSVEKTVSQALVGLVIHCAVSRFNGVKHTVWIENVNVFFPFLNSVVILSGFLHCLQSS